MNPTELTSLGETLSPGEGEAVWAGRSSCSRPLDWQQINNSDKHRELKVCGAVFVCFEVHYISINIS